MSRLRIPPGRRKNRPGVEALEGRQLLATFTVTSVADSGAGTLRDAILQANAASGLDTINFAIAGAGTHTIIPTSRLPAVTDPAVLDATTQPGYSGLPLIELNGANILNGTNPVAGVNGLDLTAGASTVRGLAINRFTGFGISATGDANTITANFVGTDATGLISLRNQNGGIAITSRNNVVGGAAGARNVISGNAGPGLFLTGSGSQQITNNSIQGNLIGTNVNGTGDLGNTGDGITTNSAGNRIGGVTPNVVAFNGGAGVSVNFAAQQGSIYVSNTISQNSIFSNAGKGIAIFSFFAANPGAPAISSAALVPGGTQVEGNLSGVAANATYFLEFFSNTEADSSGFGEGRTYLGSQAVTTDAQGTANFSVLLPASLAVGQFVTADATDSAGSTRSFSNALPVGTTPSADLSIDGYSTSLSSQTGQPLSFVLNVRNDGPSRSADTIVTDALPQGATFVSAATTQGTVPTSAVDGKVTFDLGSLNSGQIVQLRLTVQPTVSGTLANVATVTDALDTNTTNNQSTIFTTVDPTPPADLVILGASSPDPVAIGADLTYLFVVQNTSYRAGATGVTVTDVLPVGLTFVSARSSQGTVTETNGTVVANLGSIPAAANATVTIIVRPTLAGLISNAATVRGNETDPDVTNNDVVVNTTVNAAPPADLYVAVTAAPQPAQVGLPFTYAVLVGNRGPAPATNVVLSDLLPDAATIVSIRPSQGTASESGGVVTANLGNLPVGAVAVLTIVIQPGAPGTLMSRADVTADQPDFNIADNSSSLTVGSVANAVPPLIIVQRLVVAQGEIKAAVLTFDQALDPALANQTDNYRIRDLGGNPRLAPEKGRIVALDSAVYDPTTRSVRITPAKGLKIGHYYSLVVNGPGAPGVVNLNGVVLDGDLNGLPDGIYNSLIGRGTHSRPRKLQLGVVGSAPKVHHRPVRHTVKVPRTPTKPTTVNVVVNN